MDLQCWKDVSYTGLHFTEILQKKNPHKRAPFQRTEKVFVWAPGEIDEDASLLSVILLSLVFGYNKAPQQIAVPNNSWVENSGSVFENQN